jgi:Fe-Mn family superoxide dismutase
MAFSLPDLTYEYDALEPFIDARTMYIHHTQHHAGYTKKFNAAIKGTALEEMKPSDIFAEVSTHNDAVRNNGGGFFNHALFWLLLTPNQKQITDTDLSDSINKYFGTLENLKESFSNAAKNRFGSGWAWLIKKRDGELVVTSTPNQDNPLMDVAPIKGTPILCLDVWEHAYYLKYQNDRKAYIEAFWNVVNWDKVAELFHK